VKKIYILGILIFLISTISLVSATIVQLPSLTVIDSGTNADSTEIGAINANGIDVTYDDALGTITFKDKLTNPNSAIKQGIVAIAYNVGGTNNIPTSIGGINANILPLQLITLNWGTVNQGFAQGQFGSFDYKYGEGNSATRYREVVVHLTTNLQPSKVAVHYAFVSDHSGFVSSGNSGNIPEFPTVAIPVAAILGIMFIFGRRNKE